jgi:hypothetical protein
MSPQSSARMAEKGAITDSEYLPRNGPVRPVAGPNMWQDKK